MRFLWLYIGLVSQAAFAQSRDELTQQAEWLLAERQPAEALARLDKIQRHHDKPDARLLYLRGNAYWQRGEWDRALTYWLAAVNVKEPAYQAHFQLGRLYQAQAKHEDAALHYRLFLKQSPAADLDRAAAKTALLQCLNAPQLAQPAKKALVTPLGESLNTHHHEFGLLPNPRFAQRLFYTSTQHRSTPLPSEKNPLPRTDAHLYETALEEGNWLAGQPLGKRYNSDQDATLLGFPDGGYQILYREQQPDGRLRYWVDNLDDESQSLRVPFAPELNLEASRAEDFYFFQDNLLIFSALREGGFGGLDLYASLRNESGKWGAPINLGAQINSPHDERTPFLANDGRTLYWSSNRPQTLGGFDVFRAQFNDTTRRWGQPEHLAEPVNSGGEELFFQLDPNGVSGRLASERVGGAGGLDLYMVYFRKHLPEQEMLSNPPSFAEVLLQTPDNESNPKPNWAKANPDSAQVGGVEKFQNPPKNGTAVQERFQFLPMCYDEVLGDAPVARRSQETLAGLLKRYPQVQVQISVHTDNTGNPKNDLFLSVKQAEAFAEPLIRQGIDPARIRLCGLGQQYPVAINELYDGSPKSEFLKW